MSSLFENTTPTPGADNFIRVVIDDVDPSNRVAHVFDKTGSRLQALYTDQQAGILVVPSQGEVWTAIRRGYSWFLTSKVAFDDDLPNLPQGTMRIAAVGSIKLLGEGGDIKENPWGGTIYDRFYDLNAGFTSVVLSRDAVGAATIVPYLNGLAVMPYLWTYDESTRTIYFYDEVGEIGNLVVVYQTWSPNYDDVATVSGRGYVRAVEEYDPA